LLAESDSAKNLSDKRNYKFFEFLIILRKLSHKTYQMHLNQITLGGGRGGGWEGDCYKPLIVCHMINKKRYFSVEIQFKNTPKTQNQS